VGGWRFPKLSHGNIIYLRLLGGWRRWLKPNFQAEWRVEHGRTHELGPPSLPTKIHYNLSFKRLQDEPFSKKISK
jgi:hypothetical protein